MKLIISTIIGLIVFAIVWYYIPEPTRNKVVNFTGKVVEHDPKEFPQLAKEEFLPKSPTERREAIISQLKSNIEKIKTGSEPAIILETERLLEELKKANEEKPSIADKIIDQIFPAREKVCDPPKT